MSRLVVVTVPGLDRVRCQQNRRFWGAVNFVPDDGVLHLEVKQAQRDILDEFLGHVFRVKFGTKFELERVLLLDILVDDLRVEKMRCSFRQLGLDTKHVRLTHVENGMWPL